MATKDDTAKTEVKQVRPQIRWDDSKMKSTYANVCNVSSTREEMTLLFGTNQTWHTGQKELTIELTDRIVLNPYAAKRLSILLGNTIREFEARFGELKIDAVEPPKPTEKK
jgi:hypothetical protein